MKQMMIEQWLNELIRLEDFIDSIVSKINDINIDFDDVDLAKIK